MSFHNLRPPSLTFGTAVAAAALGACAASSPVPPERDPYFPAALAIAPDDSHLFVANANSDLKFGSGSVQVYDLAAISQLVDGWQGGTAAAPAGCTADPFRPELALCPSTVGGTRAGYVVHAAQIGNFSSSIGVQELTGGILRLFSTVRGDPSITWIDYDPATRLLGCGGSGSFPRCDDRHRLDTFRNDPDLGDLPAEPFGVAVDSLRQHVVVTHLTSGRVSLVRAPNDPTAAPTLQDSLSGIWAPNFSQGVISAVGVAARLPGDPSGLFYVTSRSEARINIVRAVDTAAPDGTPTARLVRADSFFYAPPPASDRTDGDARGITFSPDGNQAYVVSRTPASLMIFDTSIDITGAPRNQLLGQVEVCPRPNDVAVVDTDAGPRVYVPCFDTGEVWVVDADHALLEATITVGRGPDSIVIAPTRLLAYVANYGDDTISVVDLDPTSDSYHHTVLQLGKLRGED